MKCQKVCVFFILSVFQAQGPYGFHNLTQPQAVSLCQEYGTELASPDDLLSAKEMGLSMCRCGWLSDGSNGFVMQTVDFGTWCYDTNAEGINDCGYALADAYCLLK